MSVRAPIVCAWWQQSNCFNVTPVYFPESNINANVNSRKIKFSLPFSLQTTVILLLKTMMSPLFYLDDEYIFDTNKTCFKCCLVKKLNV